MKIISPIAFFSHLKWIDGRPLLDVIEPYRRKIFMDALYTFDAEGVPQYNLVLSGRAKKNWKTADLILATLYRLLVWPSRPASALLSLAFSFLGFHLVAFRAEPQPNPATDLLGDGYTVSLAHLL